MFSSQSEKRQSRLLTQLCVLLRILYQVFYNRTLTNSHLPHNRGHGFRKIITLQGCPNLAHHKLTICGVATPCWEDPSILGIPSSRYFNKGKTNPARPPGVSTS